MKAARARVLFATALSAVGCAANPGPNQRLLGELTAPGPALAATVSLRVEVAMPPRALLSTTARRWQTEDVKLLRVKLLQHNGSGYVDTGLTQDMDRKVAPIATGANFQNLAAGKQYRATVEAWGEAGGAAATALLNAQNPAHADFDFTTTPGQDLGASRSATVAVQLDAVAFSGTARVALGSKPANTASVEAQLWVQGGSSALATQALASNVGSVLFGGLRAGPDYEVRLKAQDANSAALAEVASTSFRFDPAAASLNQEVAFGLNFPGASPGPSPSPSAAASQAPFTYSTVETVAGVNAAAHVALDKQGNAWVGKGSSSFGTNPHVVNSLGSLLPALSTSWFATAARAVAVDPNSGQIWVAGSVSNAVSASLTRLSSVGSFLSSFHTDTHDRRTVFQAQVDAAGVLWVSYNNNTNAAVVRIASPGSLLSATPLTNPQDFSLDAQGNAWVLESNPARPVKNNLVKLGSQGQVLASYAMPVTLNNGGVLATAQGEVWVASNTSGQLLRLNSVGGVLSSLALANARALAQSPDGTVWVVSSAYEIHRFSSSGQFLASHAVGGGSSSVAVAPNGTVWVANNSSDSLSILRPTSAQ